MSTETFTAALAAVFGAKAAVSLTLFYCSS